MSPEQPQGSGKVRNGVLMSWRLHPSLRRQFGLVHLRQVLNIVYTAFKASLGEL